MKTRIITAVVGIVVLIGVLFTFDTLIFNLVITAITLIALHEIYAALGFEKQGWPLFWVLVPYTFLIMLSSYELCRRLVMPASFLVVLPVFRRERVEIHRRNPQLLAVVGDVLEDGGTLFVPGRAGQAPLLGPAAVAVHNDADGQALGSWPRKSRPENFSRRTSPRR